jgi:hypothetical protein
MIFFPLLLLLLRSLGWDADGFYIDIALKSFDRMIVLYAVRRRVWMGGLSLLVRMIMYVTPYSPFPSILPLYLPY